MELLHCAILLAVIIQAQASVSVAGLESVEVRAGEEAMLSCTTQSDLAFCQFEDPAGETFILSSDSVYQDGRLSYHGKDPKKDCGIRIGNVKESDNGNWTCKLYIKHEGNTINVKKQAAVIVSKPPTSIHIEVDGAQKSEEVINFTESKSRKVSCVSDGARPAVKFSWMLGEDPYTGEVKDLADQTKEDGSVKQVQEVQYTAEPGHNGKRLVCSVENRGFTQEDIAQGRNQAGLQLDVQFQPVAADQPEIFYNVKTGETKDILMNFRAHPRPSTVIWRLPKGVELLESAESLDKNFKAERLMDGPMDGKFTAKLVIKDVTEEIAKSDMKLEVTNALGTTVYPFKLSLGEKPAPAPPAVSGDKGSLTTTATGTGPVIAIVVVAIIIIVIIVITVIARSQGMLCFADSNLGEDGKKSTAQFEALEKGDDQPEKELIKESNNKPVVNSNEPKAETVNEKDEKNSNGNHTPV